MIDTASEISRTNITKPTMKAMIVYALLVRIEGLFSTKGCLASQTTALFSARITLLWMTSGVDPIFVQAIPRKPSPPIIAKVIHTGKKIFILSLDIYPYIRIIIEHIYNPVK